MNISARIENRRDTQSVTLSTDGREHPLSIPPKPEGFGSSANGGELLFLALATCYCNDLYREARRRNIELHSVRVEVTGSSAPKEKVPKTSPTVPPSRAALRKKICSLSCATQTPLPKSRTPFALPYP